MRSYCVQAGVSRQSLCKSQQYFFHSAVNSEGIGFAPVRGQKSEDWSPQCDGIDGKGVVVDARGGESNSQHVLFRGDVVLGGDAVQIIHVAERETRWGRREKKYYNGKKKKSVSHTRGYFY